MPEGKGFQRDENPDFPISLPPVGFGRFFFFGWFGAEHPEDN